MEYVCQSVLYIPTYMSVAIVAKTIANCRTSYHLSAYSINLSSKKFSGFAVFTMKNMKVWLMIALFKNLF